MVTRIGPPAMLCCEPGQAWKGAAAAADACAGVWLVRVHHQLCAFSSYQRRIQLEWSLLKKQTLQ